MTATADHAQLFVWNFKDDNGDQVLIGPNPAEDPSKLYRWPSRPGGWEQREPWPSSLIVKDVALPVVPAAGKISGWPGARGPGRPRGEASVLVSIAVSVDVYARVLAQASAADQLVGEWVVAVLRKVPMEVPSVTIGRGARAIVRARVPRALVITHQLAAATAKLLLTDWLAAVVTSAAGASS